MGYDLIAWSAEDRFSDDEAKSIYGQICGDGQTALRTTERVERFYRDLIKRYPEFDGENDDSSPWSCEIEKTGSYVRVECVWSKADEVDFEFRRLAASRGLAVFDPPEVHITYPDEWNASEWRPTGAPEEWKRPPRSDRPKPWWKFW